MKSVTLADGVKFSAKRRGLKITIAIGVKLVADGGRVFLEQPDEG